jgi:alkylhydroperoxidase/carboxymuconolactone decarboxylase family protein YurZ
MPKRATSKERDSKAHAKAAGMRVRRQILGEAHVDAAVARTKPYSRDFQDLIVTYGWGEVWTRPGLDHHIRRILVMGTMVALGRWEEFRMHVRPALEGGFPLEEITEMLLQQAIYCGVPAANTAFRHLSEVIEELRGKGVKINGAIE